MHLFHKWGPWSKPVNEPIKIRNLEPMQGYTFYRTYQQRECATCGKVEERQL